MSAAIVFSTAMFTAISFVVMLSMMITLHIRIIVQLSFQESLHSLVSIS